MRKRIVSGPARAHTRVEIDHGWLDLEQIATVEVTSEELGFPIESVFSSGDGPGWRASQDGEQLIRVIFDQPVPVRRIELHFLEPEQERTQEFTLRWSAAQGGPTKEIVRQQWNFSPGASTSELEEYDVNLDSVSALELNIRPSLQFGQGRATLAAFRVA
jgi:hypothetical protein